MWRAKICAIHFLPSQSCEGSAAGIKTLNDCRGLNLLSSQVNPLLSYLLRPTDEFSIGWLRCPLKSVATFRQRLRSLAGSNRPCSNHCETTFLQCSLALWWDRMCRSEFWEKLQSTGSHCRNLAWKEKELHEWTNTLQQWFKSLIGAHE